MIKLLFFIVVRNQFYEDKLNVIIQMLKRVISRNFFAIDKYIYEKLDGFKLGHGYLGLEAMASKVPVIYPLKRKAYGNVEDFLLKTSNQFKAKDINSYKQNYLLCFDTEEELLLITNK